MQFFKALFILILIVSPAFPQKGLSVVGGDDIGLNEIVEVKTDIELSYDKDGLPSHTIEWELPDALEDKYKTYLNGTLLVFPSGCSPSNITIRVRVIDWMKRRIEKSKIVVVVGAGDSPILPPVPPDVEPDPDDPFNPDLLGDFYKTSIDQLTKVKAIDTDFVARANILSKNFGIVIGEINDNKFIDAVSMLTKLRELNNTNWPDNSKIKWQEWRGAIADLFVEKQFQQVADFSAPFEEIKIALLEVAK